VATTANLTAMLLKATAPILMLAIAKIQVNANQASAMPQTYVLLSALKATLLAITSIAATAKQAQNACLVLVYLTPASPVALHLRHREVIRMVVSALMVMSAVRLTAAPTICVLAHAQVVRP
jgi:hypothetical protein